MGTNSSGLIQGFQEYLYLYKRRLQITLSKWKSIQLAMKMSKKLRKMPKRRNKNNVAEIERPSLFGAGATKTGIMMIGVPASLVTIGKDLDHLKGEKNVNTIKVQAGMIIGEQMKDISLIDRSQGTEATVEDPVVATTSMTMTIKLN